MANNYNLEMVRGDTLSFDVKVTELEATIASLYFTVKKSYTDTTPVIQKSIGDGISMTDADTYRVRVAPEDTEGVTPGTYVYDIQLGMGGDIYTPLMGKLTILPDVTEASA